MDAGLLLLRLAVGLTLAAHGAQKLFGWFGGPGRAGFAQFVESLGFRRGRVYAWAGGIAEFAGGLLLAVGLLTPLAAAAIIAMMLAATALVHLSNGFFNTNGGFELPFILAVAAAAITIAGPGAYAVDTVLALPLTGPAWAVAAIAAGALVALAVVGLRQLDTRRGSGTVRARAA